MQPINLDNKGQPPTRLNLASNEIKAINTLYGIILGITADDYVNDDEIVFLKVWLSDNQPYTHNFPLNVISQQIDAILEDGIVTDEERTHLYKILSDIIGGNFHNTGASGGLSTTHSLNTPETLIISGSIFCLTGDFIAAPRPKIEQTIKKFGGLSVKNVTQKTNYLVIGTMASRDWVASSHGRKIEKAQHYNQQGHRIEIISEQHFLNFIHI